MAYNLAGIRKRVLVDKLDDDEFEPEVVDNFINDTLRNIYNQFELPFQEKIFQGTIPAGASMFQLPDDLALMQSQTLAGVPGFSKLQVRWREFIQRNPDVANAPASAPGMWALYSNNILLSAPTDKEYTMTMYYIKKPKRLEQDTDIPELPEEFEELLVLGAYKRILDRNEDFDLGNAVETQYQNILSQLVNRYGYREADGPIIMKNRQIRI